MAFRASSCVYCRIGVWRSSVLLDFFLRHSWARSTFLLQYTVLTATILWLYRDDGSTTLHSRREVCLESYFTLSLIFIFLVPGVLMLPCKGHPLVAPIG